MEGASETRQQELTLCSSTMHACAMDSWMLMSVDFSAGLLWPAVGRHGLGPAVRDCSIAMWCNLGAGPLDWAFQPQNPYASQEQQQHRVLYSCAHRHHASLVYAAFSHASVQ